GLLRQGAEGWALTWMDARIDGVPVTPRPGKPVEVNALWIRTLDVAARLAPAAAESRWQSLADRARGSFASRFLRHDDESGLVDVIDGPGGTDASVRPNQLIALALPGVLPGGSNQRIETAARSAVEACGRLLLTPLGLRSLAPTDPRYLPFH